MSMRFIRVVAGSVTYRLCACADTGSSIEADNAMLSLTEY